MSDLPPEPWTRGTTTVATVALVLILVGIGLLAFGHVVVVGGVIATVGLLMMLPTILVIDYRDCAHKRARGEECAEPNPYP